MDITKITDLNELKALAYDAILAIEQQQNNLRVIQQRIAQMSEEMSLRYEKLGGDKTELAQIVKDAVEQTSNTTES